jgi:hypothetical protein
VAAERLPEKQQYVLDAGTRGRAAWRVVRLPGPTGPVRLRAVRIDPGQGLETTVTADEDRGDECHMGTYRDVVGPGIGDALATLRGRS